MSVKNFELLTVKKFSEINRLRCNRHYHTLSNFKDSLEGNASIDSWTAECWMTAILGELGEAANILKKIIRGDYKHNNELQENAINCLRTELADTVTYIDLLMSFLNSSNSKEYDLYYMLAKKFNSVSERIGSNLFIAPSGEPLEIFNNKNISNPID